MKSNLMYSGGCVNRSGLNYEADDLKYDLELDEILTHMAKGDKAIYDACQDALMRPLQNSEAIKYRQKNLHDALNNPDAVWRLYKISTISEHLEKKRLKPTRLVESFSKAAELLKIYAKLFLDLREVADKRLSDFESEGFRDLLTMLQRELGDDYIAKVNNLIDEVKNVNNILVSAKLGRNLRSIDYTLRRKEKGYWLRWYLLPSFTVNAERDPAELEDLFLRRDRAIGEATEVLERAAEFIKSFFEMLRSELGFYIGCLNLIEKIQEIGMPYCFPTLSSVDSTERTWHGLYDLSLALIKGSGVVGNDLDTVGKRLYIITGANQGGKSTFLRSIGQAQLMAQCGMPVGAESFCAPIRRSIFTHFLREEDREMESGKLDEELARISRIADYLEHGSMVLFNESFSSTNKREGSEICRQVTRALIENEVEVFSVTHLFLYATAFLGDGETQHLLAQRGKDGERTFKILPGEPEETAYGEDLYKEIFVKSGMEMPL